MEPGAVEEAVKKVRHPGLREVIRRALTPNQSRDYQQKRS